MNAAPGGQVLALRFPDGQERAFRHRGSRADQGVIAQIFQDQAYSLAPLQRGAELQSLYGRLAASGRTPFILDAGANIGASAAYFAHQFPGARILAIEPAPDNFALLETNVAGLNVEARRAALGALEGETTLVDPGEGEWGYRTEDGASGPRVPVLSATRLVSDAKACGMAPFIAKIDIEGGEAALFASDTAWVDAFPLLIVELHDWLLPRGGTSKSFLQCMAARDRDFVFLGENVFSIAHHWTGDAIRA